MVFERINREEDMMSLEFKKDILFRRLKQDILSGVYPPGYRFPPELEFAKQNGVSFQTIRSALGMLCASGLIARIPGKGTFVLDAEKFPKEAETRKKDILLLFPEYPGTPGKSTLFDRELMLSVMEEAYLRGYTMVPGDQKRDAENLLKRFKQGEFSGIIWDRLMPEMRDLVAILRDNGVPQSLINRKIEGIPSISCDYPAALRQAGRFLRSIGHQHILLVDFLPNRDVYKERQQTLREIFLYEENRSMGDYILPLPQSAPSGWFQIARTWKRMPHITAMIVSSIHFPAVQKFIEETGVSVPQELSVIIWGESDQFNRKSPQSYTILTEPRHAVGVKAVEQLFHKLNGEKTSEEPILLDGELILRKGCALPRTIQEKD